MKLLMTDWFHQCFVPDVKLYLVEKNLKFKVLLFMDNAGGHAEQDHLWDGEEEEEVGLTLDHHVAMVRKAKDLQWVADEWDPQMLHLLHFVNTIESGK